MKRLMSVTLILSLLMLLSAPSYAALGNDLVLNPQGSLSLRGGLAYDSSVGKYYMHGQGFGADETKTITVTIYKQIGSAWHYIDSTSSTGTTSTVSAGKHVTLASGYYKVNVTGTTATSSGTIPYYYTI